MASVRKRNGRYVGLFRNAAGDQRSAGTYGDYDEAMAHAVLAEKGARPSQEHTSAMLFHQEKRGMPTIAAYGPLAIAGAKLEATSRETYTFLFQHVLGEFGGKALGEITPANARAFARKLEAMVAAGQMSSSTASHIFSVLRLICVTAIQDYPELRDPTAGLSVQRKGVGERRIATPEQAKAIERAIPAHYRLLVETAFASGLRYGELTALRSADIVQTPGGKYVIKVRRSIAEVSGKPVERAYGKTRCAMRNVPVRKHLALRLIAAAPQDGRIFVTTRGSYVRRSNFSKIWKRACIKAGVPGLTPHSARHSVASWLANDPTVSLVSVQVMLGHSSLAQTSSYCHHIDDGDDPRLAALEKFAA